MANINRKFDGFKEIVKIMPTFQHEESSVPIGSTEGAPGVQASKQVPATDDNKQKRRASVGSTSTIPDLNKRNKKGETLLHTACTKVLGILQNDRTASDNTFKNNKMKNEKFQVYNYLIYLYTNFSKTEKNIKETLT
jgi:hypothetical protein